MMIHRTINGEKYNIELSDYELYTAYEEQRHKFDRDDCFDVVDSLGENEVQKYYGVSKAVFLSLVDDMAYAMRKNIDKYDMGWQEARDEAVKTVLRKRKMNEL